MIVPESKRERAVLLFIELATALAIFVSVVWGGFWLVFGPDGPLRDRMVGLVQLASDSWKAFLVLLVPLYFRSVRVFMGRVTKAFGVEAVQPVGQSPQEENPSSPPPTP